MALLQQCKNYLGCFWDRRQGAWKASLENSPCKVGKRLKRESWGRQGQLLLLRDGQLWLLEATGDLNAWLQVSNTGNKGRGSPGGGGRVPGALGPGADRCVIVFSNIKAFSFAGSLLREVKRTIQNSFRKSTKLAGFTRPLPAMVNNTR